MWTEQDEANCQLKKREYFDRIKQEDNERLNLANQGLIPKCPNCGSHRYYESVYSEVCDDFGLSQKY